MMTSDCGDVGRTAFSVSKPDIPGILRSSRMMSGTSRSRPATRASPESKPETRCCRLDNRLVIAVRIAGSSSVTKIVARMSTHGDLGLLSQGEPDAGGRARADLAADLDVARMGLDDIAANGQAQART